ncbi:serine hydrolase [Azospirillum sp. TSO22-1]|uniref:serine hydrolase domain-containing protein n=1 Tax=Azospirillum sp. TSO22-1 TaxID=716789 RepID=UPI000D622DBF|nr:serine hydrolase [Azospirillum sp. TSO22-1]PWC56632.1 beta-lactamase [Azospirillum sp. TSO22-1]
MSALLRIAAALLILTAPAALAVENPSFSPAGPDADAYGAAAGYPVGRRGAREQRVLVGTFSHFDRIYDSRPVARAPVASPLKRTDHGVTLRYRYERRDRSIEDYLAEHPVTGFLIAKGDTILDERYQYGRTDRDRFTSQSMAKTITGMLVGIAVSEGAIRSIDEPAAAYVPGLAGTEYGATPIRALLHMASGVAFREDYGGADDIARMGRALFGKAPPDPVATVAQFNTRDAPPGTRFRYASIETEILGLILRNATGMPVADYLRTRIWQPMGAESDATWVVDSAGQEATYCCFNAVLRDYARFALLLAHDGAWQDRQIIPRQWLLDATTVHAGEEYLAPGTATSYSGYGYQVWLLPGGRRMFALRGVYGQVIFVDPASKLVLVHTAARRVPANDPAARELPALWSALVERFGN